MQGRASLGCKGACVLVPVQGGLKTCTKVCVCVCMCARGLEQMHPQDQGPRNQGCMLLAKGLQLRERWWGMRRQEELEDVSYSTSRAATRGWQDLACSSCTLSHAP